jgi:pimeloyl-ACP methyl ester carboxylesterase
LGKAGKLFLAQAIRHYHSVVGFDHRTLGKTPQENAKDIHEALGSLASEKIEIDTISHSRGGITLRSLIEQKKLPGGISLGKAYYVGATCGGTELANPQKVKDFVDLYTNLAAAVCRIARHVPDPHVAVATQVLAETFKTLADLIKVLAAEALDDRVVPGLAAMNPDGAFIKNLNAAIPTELNRYHAITSEFDGMAAFKEIKRHGVVHGLLKSVEAGLATQLLSSANDLVVNTPNMSVAGPGQAISPALAYGRNGIVHHLNYFLEDQTIDTLIRGLGI